MKVTSDQNISAAKDMFRTAIGDRARWISINNDDATYYTHIDWITNFYLQQVEYYSSVAKKDLEDQKIKLSSEQLDLLSEAVHHAFRSLLETEKLRHIANDLDVLFARDRSNAVTFTDDEKKTIRRVLGGDLSARFLAAPEISPRSSVPRLQPRNGVGRVIEEMQRRGNRFCNNDHDIP